MHRIFMCTITWTWRCDHNSQPWVLWMRAHSYAEKNYSYCSHKNMIVLYYPKIWSPSSATQKVLTGLVEMFTCAQSFGLLHILTTFLPLLAEKRDPSGLNATSWGESYKHIIIWYLNNQCMLCDTSWYIYIYIPELAHTVPCYRPNCVNKFLLKLWQCTCPRHLLRLLLACLCRILVGLYLMWTPVK